MDRRRSGSGGKEKIPVPARNGDSAFHAGSYKTLVEYGI